MIELNEHIKKQIRLMKFDRSKTLLEQGTDDWYEMSPDLTPKSSKDPFIDKSTGTVSFGSEPTCDNEKYFRNSYPDCCKYPNLAKFTSFSDEKALPFKNGTGWCFYRDSRGFDLYVPSGADLTFSNENFYNTLTEKFLEIFKSDIKLFYQTIWNSVDFKRVLQNIESNYVSLTSEEKRDSAINIYVRQRVEQLLPVGSIIKIDVNEGLYVFDVNLYVDEVTSDLMFDWYYEQNGKQYDQPKSVDLRTDYQKIVDEWGMWIQMAVLIAASVMSGFAAAPAWALWLEVGLELGTGLLLAKRDFEKGDNIMGVVNILSGGLSALKFIPAFRGISSEVAKRAALALKNSGLKETSNAKDYLKFIKKLKKTDPEAAQVLNKMAKFDDYTKNLIQNELPKRISKEIIDNVKTAITKNPKLLGDVKFWDRLWAMDLKRQLGAVAIGVALDFSPLGKILNNEEKQKYEWILNNIPDYSRKNYDFNAANNPEIQKEIINDFANDLIEKCKNITEEDIQKGLLAIQEIKIKEKSGRYEETNSDIQKTTETLLKEGFIEITNIQETDFDLVEHFEVSTDGKYFIKNKKQEIEKK
jgi:hypothetical protein